MEITIKHYGFKLSAEIDDDSDIHQVGTVLKALLIGIGFGQESVDLILPDGLYEASGESLYNRHANIRSALYEAVTAIEFNDGSDFKPALYAVVGHLTETVDVGDELIKKLFKELTDE
jgi:hypothetical protein